MSAIVVLFVVVTALGIMYERAKATQEVGAEATRDAAFAARLVARDIDRDLETARTVVSHLAANAGIARVFETPEGCTLDFSGAGTFTSGHLDIVASDGGVPCSSMPAPPARAYHDASWLSSALAAPTISEPMDDARSGAKVVVVSSPIPGHGVVAAFLDLDSLGPGLSSSFGGPRRFEFLLATGDGRRAVTRSIDPQRWAGASLAGTPFADPTATPRADVEGHPRFYASATVKANGWQVYAGADRNDTRAGADALVRRELLVALTVLGVIIAAVFAVSRSIASPISLLSERVRLPVGGMPRAPVRVSGPREVAQLAEGFNQLSEALHRELEATARFAAIVESSHDSVISRTPDGIITSWNHASERMYGYSAEEAIGANLSTIIVPPERAAEIARVHERVLRGESVPPLETQRVRRDGSRVDIAVTVSPVRDQRGAIVGLSAVGRDITESKRAVEALRISEARKGAILASALDAIITMNDDGTIDEFNAGAERTFGYAAADVLGRKLADVIVPPEHREAHNRGLYRYLATGTEVLFGRRIEMKAMRANGDLFPAEVSINVVDAPGRQLFTGFVRDLTEQMAAEAERRSLEDRLHQAQRLESLGQLAGGVAHDFNNLLAVILNYAIFVAEAVPDDPSVQFDVAQIVSASERAARLTRQLLTFARREPVQPERLQLNAVVSDIRELLSRTIGEDVELDVHAGHDVPAIHADRGQTEQILLNLAVNARDAMPDGGTLTIETAAVDLDENYARLHPGAKPGRYVQLSVSDTGVGMSREVAAQAFDPFFTTKAKAEGSGLGLAIVYGIVAESGGAVNLYSEEGLGTTIKLFLPVDGDPRDASKVVPAAPIPGAGETVLVVEDQDAVRDVTVRILRRNGYVVLEAATGAEAISVAADNEIDLLLTDVVMPKMSGRELAEHLRISRPDLPVLYMSGYAQGLFGPLRALDEGVALIPKPFNERALLQSVHDTLTSQKRL